MKPGLIVRMVSVRIYVGDERQDYDVRLLFVREPVEKGSDQEVKVHDTIPLDSWDRQAYTRIGRGFEFQIGAL